jgi:nucleoside-diphosphate-sugar epimerase
MLMRCLLVGSTGRLGSVMMRHWLQAPRDGLSVVPQTRQSADDSVLLWSPVGGGPLPKGEFDAMLMLAGATPHASTPLSANAEIAEACLVAAEAAGIGRVLVASSAAVYGAGSGVPFRESDLTVPVNDYGRSKLEMEAVCETWRTRGLEVTSLRIGNVAGADMLLGFAEGRAVTLDKFADGSGPVRSYIGPRTLADVSGSLLMTEDQLPPVINVAAPRPTTMEDLATAAGLEVDWRPAPPGATQSVVLDCSLVASLHRFGADACSPSAMVAEISAELAA